MKKNLVIVGRFSEDGGRGAPLTHTHTGKMQLIPLLIQFSTRGREEN